MTNTNHVELTMKDGLTGETVVRRLDKINAMKSGESCWEIGHEASQRLQLTRWIEERGNEQHRTLLSLVSWKFI